MKKFLVLSVLIGSFLLANSAFAYLQNWYLDPDGAGGMDEVFITEILDTTGTTWIDNTIGADGTGTFKEWGTFFSGGHDGATGYVTYNPDFSVKDTYGGEITALFYGEGTVNLNSGQIAFTSGYLDIYVDDTNGDYGTNSDGAADYLSNPETYGANNGTRIASFEVLAGGGGVVNPFGSVAAVGAPNGTISTNMVATYINPGYWFLPDGITDFSDLPMISWILGYGTSNASYINIDPDNPGPTYGIAIDEIVNEFAGGTFTGDAPDDFIISGNGQFRVSIVPEPTTMLLLGFGLLGCAGISRRKINV